MRNCKEVEYKEAKPFLKWAGGKTQLLPEIERSLPQDFFQKQNLVYVEPFVGGGAVLFWILQKYPNISKAVINDINLELITIYKVIRNNPQKLITILKKYQDEYISLDERGRKEYYLRKRDIFNKDKDNEIENSARFIFLNRTCFNGLYRVNSKGIFNVPHGRYSNPKICDEDNILAVSMLLRKVEILSGDFEHTVKYATENSFFYLDPPYKPLSETSSFTSYSRESFDDESQIRLRDFCDRLHHSGSHFILSNSDVKGVDPNNNFFDDLYAAFDIQRVWATRMVSANAKSRGKLTELLVNNFIGGNMALNSSHNNLNYYSENLLNKKMNNMNAEFEQFLLQLNETNATLDYFTNFNKVKANVNKIAIKLNQLNYLIGKEDLRTAIKELYDENPKTFEVLDILIAVRKKDKKKTLNSEGEFVLLESYFTSLEGVITYIEETGIGQILKDKNITNLVDYVFGVEVGLDTNARKNRSGDNMSKAVALKFDTAGLTYRKEVNSSEFIDMTSLGHDLKRFDFVIKTTKKTYLIETNFYNTGGSKPNEVARSYSEIGSKINKYPQYEFVWVTDGQGWLKAKNKLEEAFSIIPNIYNLTTISTFIDKVKREC